jgi:fructuronate reductase
VKRLSRAEFGDPRPVRVVHLGLGAFHRAHQAWYTQNAGPDWGIAAYTGRRPDAADALAAQDGLYVLLTRGPSEDTAEVVTSISRAHDGSDTARWLADLGDPRVNAVTLTITEAGYRRNGQGDLDLDDPEVRADIVALQGDLKGTARTAPARIAQGLLARHGRDSGLLNVVSCDNIADNGALTRRVVVAVIEAVAPSLVGEIDAQVAFVSSMVDRITPATTEADRLSVVAMLGYDDRSPVVTEPFSEWIIADAFRAERPDWGAAGASIVPDVTPFEERKLWLLNGGHSLLAYAGSIRGHRTVAEAVADPVLRDLLFSLWDGAASELSFPRTEIDAYCAELMARFENARIEHRLAQIAVDGSQKLPVRILPVIRLRRARGLAATDGQVVALAAWLAHLRGLGAPVKDVPARAWLSSLPTDPREATTRMLQIVAPDLADDTDLVVATTEALQRFSRLP